MTRLEVGRIGLFRAKVRFHELLAGHLQELQLVAFRNGHRLELLERLEIGLSLTGVANRPSRVIRHQPLPLGYSSSIVQPSGSFNSCNLILSNSSGVTSTITDG